MFRRLGASIRKWMYGRYGSDQLNMLLLVLAACRVSAEADAQAEEAFQRMMERRSRNGNAVLHEEAIMDAGKE